MIRTSHPSWRKRLILAILTALLLTAASASPIASTVTGSDAAVHAGDCGDTSC